MATETAASDHSSTADEQYVKNEKDEAIAQKIASLANDDEDKHDKAEDAPDQTTPPSSKTEEDGVKAELTAAEVAKDDSPVLEASAEDGLKHDKVVDTTAPTEGDDQKVEPAVAIEKTEDSVPLDASVAVSDNLKEEKELVPDSHNVSVTEPVHDAATDEVPTTEPTVKETPQQLEKELSETDEVKQSKTEDIPEAPAETVEESSKKDEANPLTESEADVVKVAEVPEPEPESEPELVATPVQEKIEEPEKESQKAEKPSTIAVPEPSVETVEKPSDIEEEETAKPSAEVLKETKNYEVVPTETVKVEHVVVTEVGEDQKEPENQSIEQREEEKLDTSAIPEHSTETSDATEEKTREPEFEAEVLKETNNYKAGPTETEKAESVATIVDENQSEPEKQSSKQEKEEQPKIVDETNNYEAGPTEIEKAESVATKVDENQSEPEKQSYKQEDEEQTKTVIPETEAESAEQSSSVVEDHPPKDSDIELVKETENSVLETVPTKEEKPEPLSTEVEEKPREQPQVVEEVEETSKDIEAKQEIVLETAKSEGTSDDTIIDSISKEEKTDKEEETSLSVNAAQVSSNGEAQAAPQNLVEPSPEIVEKVVEEDGNKESSFTEVIEGVSSEVAGIVENPEQASADQEAKSGLKEEREYSVPTSVEEKVAIVANDDKKEPEAPDAVPEFSREVEVESKKVEEQNETKTATTEAESVKVESVEDNSSAVDNKKEEKADIKVDEISTAVSEPVRETLASKFEKYDAESAESGVNSLEKEQTVEPEKTEVQATKESDATKTTKDIQKETPAKPAQKQSNNIISKVKQSLVKAKKAITGKSPSSKNLTSEAKGDIKVK